MKTQYIGIAFSALVLASVAAACGDDESAGGASATTATTATTSGGPTTSTKASTTASGSSSTGNNGFPAAPALGADQLDRMARPAINTALNETFVKTNGGVGPSDDTMREAAEDGFNATKDPTQWASFRTTAATQLAVLDGLDGTCGNQALSCTDGSPNLTCYGALADILMNDRLWVATTFDVCTSYLGVELKALNAAAPLDCGGRRPVDDVIATTYTVLSGAAAFDDGITAPTGLHPEAFPYFAPPHP